MIRYSDDFLDQITGDLNEVSMSEWVTSNEALIIRRASSVLFTLKTRQTKLGDEADVRDPATSSPRVD